MNQNQNSPTKPEAGKSFGGLNARKYRSLRKKWVTPLATLSLVDALYKIEGSGIRQLEATLKAMESCSPTNCWWAEYRAAQQYREDVEKALRMKRSKARKKISSANVRDHRPLDDGVTDAARNEQASDMTAGRD